MSEKELNLDEMRASLERILEDDKDALPPAAESLIANVLQKLSHVEAVNRNLESIENVVLEPVGEKLVEQIEEHRKSSSTNRLIGIVGTIIGLVGAGTYFFDPLSKDEEVEQTRTDIEKLTENFGDLQADYSDLAGGLDVIDERLRVALIEKLDPVSNVGLNPIEGEQKFRQNRNIVLLTNDELRIQIYVTNTGIDWTEGSPHWKYAAVNLYSNDRLVSDASFEEIVAVDRLNKDLPEISLSRWREGDVVTIFGLYQFVVTRIESRQLHGRDVADADNAMYLKPLDGDE